MANEKQKLEIDFLLEIYSEDPRIADSKVMEFLKLAYPRSKATFKTLALWKNAFRRIGIDVPKKRR